MNGRSAVSLLALFTLLGTALSGCLEAPSFLTGSDSEATARDNLDLAQNAAKAWSPDAVLVGVSTFEASAFHADQSMGMVPADPTVGNGRALLWMYAFQTPDGAETRVFRVEADGAIRTENTSMVPVDEIPRGEALGEWSIDSDKAVEAARTDAAFAKAMEGGNSSLAAGLARHEGRAQWALVAVAEAAVVVAVVDAATGEVTFTHQADPADYAFDVGAPGAPYSGAAPVQVHMMGEGVLDMGTRVHEASFTYAGHGDEGVLDLRVMKRMLGDAIEWAILDADGETVAHGDLGRLSMPEEEGRFELQLDEPGEYVLQLAYAPRTFVPLGAVTFEYVLQVGGDLPDEDEE